MRVTACVFWQLWRPFDAKFFKIGTVLGVSIPTTNKEDLVIVSWNGSREIWQLNIWQLSVWERPIGRLKLSAGCDSQSYRSLRQAEGVRNFPSDVSIPTTSHQEPPSQIDNWYETFATPVYYWREIWIWQVDHFTADHLTTGCFNYTISHFKRDRPSTFTYCFWHYHAGLFWMRIFAISPYCTEKLQHNTSLRIGSFPNFWIRLWW